MGPLYFTYVVGVLLNYSYTGKMGSFDAKKLNKAEGDDVTKGMVHDQAKKGRNLLVQRMNQKSFTWIIL